MLPFMAIYLGQFISSISGIQGKIKRLKTNRMNFELLEEKLKGSREPQINTIDEDLRSFLVHGQVTEVSYNI